MQKILSLISKPSNPIEKRFATYTPYHTFIFFFLFITKVPAFWHVISFLFVSPPVDYKCGNDADQQCCPDPVWNTSVFTKTIQMKYNLSCDREWLVSVSESAVSIGLLVGGFTFGFLSDRYGRLSILSLCFFVMATFGCLSVVMPTIGTFIAMRFMDGFGLGGCATTSFVLLVEYCGVQYRETVTGLYHIPMNMGHMSLAIISYYLRDCDHYQLAISIPLFLCATLNFFLQESPTWLMDTGEIDKSAQAMEKILKYNKQPYESIKAEITAYRAAQTVTTSHNKLKFWHIFRYRRPSINFVCMAYMYFACGMGFYGVSQYIGRMTGSIHLNVVVSGASLLPGTIASVFLLKIMNRKPLLMGTSGSAGLLMLVVCYIPVDYAFARVTVACICNCFFFVSFITVFLYGVELFPTSVRNSALGILTVLARVGQIIAPPINRLPEYISGGIFGVSALIGAIICLPLPETKNRELPSSLEDTERIPLKKQ